MVTEIKFAEYANVSLDDMGTLASAQGIVKRTRTRVKRISFVNQTMKQRYCVPVEGSVSAGSVDAISQRGRMKLYQGRIVNATTRLAREKTAKSAVVPREENVSVLLTVAPTNASVVPATREKNAIALPRRIRADLVMDSFATQQGNVCVENVNVKLAQNIPAQNVTNV